jgi:hypothetical protein
MDTFLVDCFDATHRFETQGGICNITTICNDPKNLLYISCATFCLMSVPPPPPKKKSPPPIPEAKKDNEMQRSFAVLPIAISESYQCSLPNTIVIENVPAENRFVRPMAELPENSMLVSDALCSVNKPSLVLRRVRHAFQGEGSPDTEMHVFDIDVPEDDDAKNKDTYADVIASPSKLPEIADEQMRAVEIESLIDTSLLEMTDLDVVRRLADAENKSPNCVMWRYHPDWSEQYTESLEKSIRNCEYQPLWTRPPATQFLVSVNRLRIGIQSSEPFFCILTLFDISSHQRISEDFHFDLNAITTLPGPLSEAKLNANKITTSRHALFSIHPRQVTQHVYLVIRIERVLMGEATANTECYFKKRVRSRGESDTLRRDCTDLGEFRQPFAWGMYQLFEQGVPILFICLYPLVIDFKIIEIMVRACRSMSLRTAEALISKSRHCTFNLRA